MPYRQSEAETSTGTSHTLTFSISPVTGNFILVGVRFTTTSSLFSSISDNKGNTYTGALEAGATTFSNGTRRIYSFQAVNITGGSAFTITFVTTSSATIRWWIAEYDSVPTSNVIDDVEVAAFTSTNNVVSDTANSTGANDTLVGFLAPDSDVTDAAPDNGETERQEIVHLIQLEDKVVGAAGGYAATWALTTAQAGTSVVWLLKATATVPEILNVNTNNVFSATQAGVNVNGTGFGSNGANASGKLVDGAITSTCTKNSFTDTLVNVDIVQGNTRYGARVFRVTTQALLTDDQNVTVTAPIGTAFVDVTTLRTLAWDVNGTPSRLTPKGSAADGTTDCTAAVQFRVVVTGGTGIATPGPDGGLLWDVTVTQVTWYWHDGAVWSSAIVWDLRGVFPKFIGPNISDLTYTQNSAITALDHNQRYTDPNGFTLTYAIQGSVTGLTWNGSTGQETGTPTALGTTSSLELRATNTEGSWVDSNSFARTIQAAPNAPVFHGTVPNFLVRVNTTFPTYDVTQHFQFASSYAVTTGTLPTGVTLTAGVLAGTPTNVVTPTIVITGSGTGTPATTNSFVIEIYDVPTATVPNVVGMTLSEAVNALEVVGLISSSVFVVTAGTPGTVTAQDIAPTTVVDQGTVVTITVIQGSGSEYVIVPVLVGLSQATAQERIATSGLTLLYVSQQYSLSTPGIVISQSLPAGESVQNGWPIGITVAVRLPGIT